MWHTQNLFKGIECGKQLFKWIYFQKESSPLSICKVDRRPRSLRVEINFFKPKVFIVNKVRQIIRFYPFNWADSEFHNFSIQVIFIYLDLQGMKEWPILREKSVVPIFMIEKEEFLLNLSISKRKTQFSLPFDEACCSLFLFNFLHFDRNRTRGLLFFYLGLIWTI